MIQLRVYPNLYYNLVCYKENPLYFVSFLKTWFVLLAFDFTPQSTIFHLCWDWSSLVEPVPSKD